MPAPDTILQLVDQFASQLASYRSLEYNEAQARREFIEPFFDVLGWDIYNKQGYAYSYKDVIFEDAIKVGGATKAPDYAFRIGGTRKFFVEAKKPSVNVKDEITPAYQLRRYAWSAKLPLSILTDFEEFAVYDCRTKPDKTDKASTGRIMLLTYRDYPSHWDEIAGVFSHQAVLKGSFDKYAEAATGKRGTAEVDDAFLAEIERWRELLVHNIALRNPSLSQRDLNYAVQMTIDRLIFLRICEDRGIEFYGQLQSLLNGGETYPRLCQLFRKADERYNSGLFHFIPERDQADTPDMLTPGLLLDDKPLKDILANLYYPDSPYEFSVLPADILGQVYERFLGKVIRLTAGHHAVVEDKPEVKKAGGVFYTPTFIVEYIVKHTLGKLLEGKAPGQVGLGRSTPIRILDMSCGSGSFLLGGYQYLLDWYLSGYSSEPEKWSRGAAPRLYQVSSPDGALWKLTTAERKRILLDHIYGVDIDPQAVEVTKLSLLLKVLEGESQESIGKQLSMFRQRALPDLASNIKCGNSLIESDFYSSHQSTFLDAEEQYRINAFDWHKEFTSVFASSGGFDVVIGNPPYISTLLLEKILHPDIKPYWKKKYQSAAGAFDIYIIFTEQGIRHLKDNGYLGYIIPNKFMAAEYAQEFRTWIFDNSVICSLLDLSKTKVWPISVYPVVPVFQKSKEKADATITVVTPLKADLSDIQQIALVKYMMLEKTPDKIWSFITRPGADTLLRLIAGCEPLEKVAEVYGASTVAEGSEYPKLLVEKDEKENQNEFARFLVSGSVFRYSNTWDTSPVQFTHKKYKRPYIKLAFPMPLRRIEQAKSAKIIICKVALEPRAFLDSEGQYVGAYTTYIFEQNLALAYIAGLLNSKLMAFLYRNLYDALAMGGGYLRFQPPQMRRLPIRQINFSDSTDIALHDLMVSLVERMQVLHQQLASANTPTEKTQFQRQIDTTDRQIDALVYELYGLTENEIRLVEGE